MLGSSDFEIEQGLFLYVIVENMFTPKTDKTICGKTNQLNHYILLNFFKKGKFKSQLKNRQDSRNLHSLRPQKD